MGAGADEPSALGVEGSFLVEAPGVRVTSGAISPSGTDQRALAGIESRKILPRNFRYRHPERMEAHEVCEARTGAVSWPSRAERAMSSEESRLFPSCSMRRKQDQSNETLQSGGR